jgi:biopolymer transport protein ExbD
VAAKPGNQPVPEVDLTPLIDVSLVLVVMLLLATPLAVESSFALRHEQAAAQEAEVEEELERVELSIESGGQVRVNGERTEIADLEAALRPLLGIPVPPTVVVTCRDEVPHGAFVFVLDTAKRSGATEIAFTEEAP